jgi:DNA-binding GntR family transcriptional regulator
MGLSNNRVIADIHEQLNRRSRLLHALYPRDYDRCRLCDDHEQLADLIARRRAKPARQLIDRHYRAILRGFRIDPGARPTMALEQAFAIEWPKQLSTRDNTVRRKELEHVGG